MPVRGKLTGLPGLEVIASNSSAPYKQLHQDPQQIGQELGVQYIVVGQGSVGKGIGGHQPGPGQPGTDPGFYRTARWQQPFRCPP